MARAEREGARHSKAVAGCDTKFFSDAGPGWGGSLTCPDWSERFDRGRVEDLPYLENRA